MKHNFLCKLCNDRNTKFLFRSNNTHGRHYLATSQKFNLIKCLTCGCIFIKGVSVDKKFYEHYYPENYYKFNKLSSYLTKNIISLLNNLSNKQKEKYILKQFKKNKKRLKILDIGCGDGKFISMLDKEKFETFGVELNEDGYKSCIAQGIKNVYQSDITFFKCKKKFDVITMWHVVEHLKDPKEALNNVNLLLKKNGVLLISTPNINSLGFNIGNKNWFHLDSPRHLTLHNKQSIEKLGNLCKFRLQKLFYEFYDYPLDLFWSVRKSKLFILIFIFYPIIKILDKETMTCFFVKK